VLDSVFPNSISESSHIRIANFNCAIKAGEVLYLLAVVRLSFSAHPMQLYLEPKMHASDMKTNSFGMGIAITEGTHVHSFRLDGSVPETDIQRALSAAVIMVEHPQEENKIKQLLNRNLVNSQ
jgi:hypothetical protein